MLKLPIEIKFASSFYIVLLFNVYDSSKHYFSPTINSSDLIWTAQLIPFVIKSGPAKSSFYVLTLFVILMNVVWTKWALRAVCSIFVITYYAFCYSNGKISHANHPWIYASIGMIFYNQFKKPTDVKNFITIRLIQATLLMSYTSSGIWKLRTIINYHGSLYNLATRPIAFSLLENGHISDFSWWLLRNEDLVVCCYLLTMLFQISTIIPILFNKYFKSFGILIIMFHIMMTVTMNIWFIPTIVAIIFFFIITETLTCSHATDDIFAPIVTY